jgi:hypothetical protein
MDAGVSVHDDGGTCRTASAPALSERGATNETHVTGT